MVFPERIPAEAMKPVAEACLAQLRAVIEILDPQYLLGVGAYAEKQLATAAEELGCEDEKTLGKILHPSPVSPRRQPRPGRNSVPETGQAREVG